MATYTIPGAALRVLEANGHVPSREVNPAEPDYLLNGAGYAFASAKPVKKGFGTRHTAELSDDQHEALCDYLDGLADLLRNMSATERGQDGDNEIYACEAALKALIPDY